MLWRCMLYTFQGAVDSLEKSDLGVLGFLAANPFLRTYILAADFDSDGHPTRPAPVLEFAPDTVQVSPDKLQLLGR